MATAQSTKSGAFMRLTGATSQPIGHYEFCQTHAPECTIRTARPSAVKLSNSLWSQLVQVNDAVNKAITPATDLELYGKSEYWAYPTTAGDCEDYVLLKRRDLMEMGWPASDLLITVVRQENGDGHAVLTVVTDRGDVVLDSLRSKISVWSETPYTYVKRQSEYDTGAWVGISDDRQTLVGSIQN